MRDQLQKLLDQRVRQCVSQERDSLHECEVIERKKESCAKRSAEIVKANATGRIITITEHEELTDVLYNVHFQYLIKQKGQFYLEEEVEQRKAEFYKGVLVEEDTDSDQYDLRTAEVPDYNLLGFRADRSIDEFQPSSDEVGRPYGYDRRKAVQYAERWWNDYNPAYKKFDVDCSNYISQCLHAGGAPMTGYPNRGKGWWMMKNNWSFSWSVANALRWYLTSSKAGLRANEVKSPDELLPGDVICYDFQGDGRFDHTTIVTAKDAYGMPLVNAHTHNSRLRYWAYQDSTAYTPQIKYKFFSIVDDQ
ncbi:amidase domain-containing protein [Bacillus sp. T33-2]|uniref:amidase domain-containing protein n=1 Tax=Bacillus sp. T33-2 TaxID=2054168 RepID=UPI000C779FF5|nr:amidase domain-containing protein [Bacillus sp. T33-2]PLR97830.1 hypothetical protein CVD19_06740 [Bacillus sp. T33-2]